MFIMSKKLFMGLLMAALFYRPATAQIAFADVQFWIGSGSDSTLLVVDFKDGSSDSSYVWGYAYSGSETGEDLINAVAAADLNFSVDISGGFLNDVVYGQHAGIGGQPNYWSTWSGADTSTLAMNSGISTALVDGEWFALSYTDFNPALLPGLPIAAFDPNSFAFADVSQWIGTGSDSMAFFIDFQLPNDSARLVFGYLFNDSVQASQILSDLDQNIAGLTVSASAFLNDIIYNSWSGIGGQPNYWSTWSASNVGNWYLNAGIGTYVKAGELFGCSYTDFAPALRPQVPLGLRNIGLQESPLLAFNVYPNPSQGLLQIEAEGIHQLHIYDSRGSLVLSSTFEDTRQLDLRDWQRGLYYLQVDQRSEPILLN